MKYVPGLVRQAASLDYVGLVFRKDICKSNRPWRPL